ncbi:hypothetical protein [Aquiflexum lacus]|uniref:hypothetical protein n=1 Tax=Aquiflexum lacus TaxID=2483805 RepID=UPI0018934951|nr:hypothetical protein [Aquiflexum lacus]
MFRFKANYLKFILPVTLGFMLLISCSKDCENTLYEINSIGLTPRTINLSTGQDGPWNNEAGFTSTNLALRLDMPKTVLNPGSLDSDCIPKYRNNNKATSIEMFSNQAFNAIPAGEDLLEVCVFTGDGLNFINKADFLQSYLNESNFPSYFILFNFKPTVEATHSLRVVVEFEDGTSKESEFVEVLLKP